MRAQTWRIVSTQLPALEHGWRQVLDLNPRPGVFLWADFRPPDRMSSTILERVAPDVDSQFAFFAADLDDENVLSLFTEANRATSP